MSEVHVEALAGFVHGEARRRGDRFSVSQPLAEAMARKGLVRVIEAGQAGADPSAAGGKPSASPAARASRRQTAKPPAAGATAPPAAPSS